MRALYALAAIGTLACSGKPAVHDAPATEPPPPPGDALVPDAPAPAPNVMISGPGLGDTEPSLAIDPRDPTHLVAAWMHFARLSPLQVDVQTRASTDGGATWGPIVTQPHQKAGFHAADVTLEFDGAGRAHLAYIDFAGDSSVPGGITDGVVVHTLATSLAPLAWRAPVVVRAIGETTDVAIDRPWLAIDTSGGPRDGTIYVVTRSANATPAGIPRHLHLKRSSDGGVTWSPNILVGGDPYPDLASPFGQAGVDASGALVVVYAAGAGPNCGLACFAAARSSDGGATFARAFVVRLAPPKSGFEFRSAVAAGPAGRFAVTWMDGRTDVSDILVARSSDGGATWAGPVRANDDALGNNVGQDEPWLAFAPDGHRLAIGWRDRRATGTGPFTTPFEIYTATSADGGATFSPNRRLSDAVSPSPDLESGNDFIGVVATAGGGVHALWSDHRTGAFAIYYGAAR